MYLRPPARGAELLVADDSRSARLLARGDALAVRLAREPLRNLTLALCAIPVLAACLALVGEAAFADRAAFFRELAPATFLSFGMLLLVAATARALHLRDGDGAAWWRSFWGLSAAVFCVFAFDEITQSAIFLADLLEHVFALTPGAGFKDLEAALLTLLFVAAGLILLPRALVLLRHPSALALLVLGALLGAASQGLDSFAPHTQWEFVAEETLKLLAGACFAGGFLVALRDVLRREEVLMPARAADAPEPAA